MFCKSWEWKIIFHLNRCTPLIAQQNSPSILISELHQQQKAKVLPINPVISGILNVTKTWSKQGHNKLLIKFLVISIVTFVIFQILIKESIRIILTVSRSKSSKFTARCLQNKLNKVESSKS